MSHTIPRQDAPLQLKLRNIGGVAGGAQAPARPLHFRAIEFCGRHTLLVGVVGIPFFFVILYYTLIASPIYMSEAEFVVRTGSSTGALSGNINLGQLSSLARSSEDTQAVNTYMSSRDAIAQLIKEDNLLELLARPEADFIARFPGFWEQPTVEALYRRFNRFADPEFDSTTGITSLYVYAFRPEDARKIALALLTHAEQLVNRLNSRARQDAISFAENLVEKARARVREAQQRITDFRSREMIFDPVRQAFATIDLTSKMGAEIAQLKASLSEVSANSPDSPKIASMRGRISALEEEIQQQRAFITGGDKSIAPKIAVYEDLSLQRDLEIKLFSSALLSLETARQEAERQQLYLERVVEPNSPDYPRYPRRFLSIFAVLGFSLCLYWILKILRDTVLEHDT